MLEKYMRTFFLNYS